MTSFVRIGQRRADPESLTIGQPPLCVRLRRHARARRLTLRVNQINGTVSLTLPARGRLAEAEAFLREREAWIRSRLAETPEPIVPAPGQTISISGQDWVLGAGAGRSARLEEGQLLVPGEGQAYLTRLRQFMRLQARTALAEACDRYSRELGQVYNRLTLRDPRSRWGSCSSAGHLMFSWRLVMAPPEVLDYVAAHEVAHLRHMHHGPEFWSQVEELLPGYSEPRAWLHSNGALLHRYRFDQT